MQKNRIIQSLALNLLAEFVNKAVPLLVLFLVVRRLGVENFGYAQFGFWLLDAAIVFIVFGFHHLAAVDLGRVNADEKACAEIVAEVISLKFFHAVASGLIIFVLVNFSPHYSQYQKVIYALMFLLLTSAIDLSFLHIGTQRMRSWSSITIFVKLLSLVSVVLFVQDADDAVLYAVLTLGANGMISILSLAYNRRYWPRALPSFKSLTTRWKRSLPIATFVILIMTLERMDLFLVDAFTDLRGLGLYSGASRLVLAVCPLIMSISAVFFSEVVAVESKESILKHLRVALNVVLAIVIPLGVCTWFLDKQLLSLLLGEEFVVISSVWSTLNFSLIPLALVMVCSWQVLVARGELRGLNFTLLFSVFVMAGLAFLLQDKESLLVFAGASLIAKTISAGGVILLTRKSLGGFPMEVFARSLIPSFAAVLLLVLIPQWNIVLRFSLAAILYAAVSMYTQRSYVTQILDRVKKTGASHG